MDVCLDPISCLGYGQLLVLDESLTVLLVLVDIIVIALCVIVLSEINDDENCTSNSREATGENG